MATSTTETYPLRLERKLLKRTKALAKAESRSIASIIRQAIDQFLQERGQ